MVAIEKFLTHVLPDSGLFCLATPGQVGWRHKVVASLNHAAKFCENSDHENTDTYFGIATLKEMQVWNPKKKKYDGTEGGYEVRTHANMDQYKTLILDLDCNGAKSYEYVDQAEGLSAVKKFVSDSGMPIPTVVNSGRGLHVYWTFTESVDADRWFELALKAVAVYNHFGLKFDPSRAKDRSSVLRVAGTHHYKDPANPLEVKVIRYGEHTPSEDIEAILDKSIAFYGLSVQKKHEPKVESEILAMFDGVGSDLREPINIDMVFAKCKQMAYVKEVGGPAGYNIRASAVSIMKLAENPDYSILLENDPSPETVEAQTDMMLRDSITNNPHTCERFESENQGGCRGCEYQGKIGSPAVLGRPHLKSSTKPVNEHTQTEYEDTQEGNVEPQEDQPAPPNQQIPPPEPYKCAPNGVHISLPTDFGSTLETVYEYEMYPLERMWDHRNCEEMVKAKVHLPHDGIREFIVPTEALADTKALSKLFTRNGVIPGSQEKLTMLSGYMSNYIRELQKYFKATTNYAQLGWQDDSTKFVLPEVVIGEGGVVENCGVSTALRATAKNFHKKGTLEAWKETVNTYAKPGYEHYAFGHLVGFGSLLFNFTQYSGAIVNMMGDSGSGKTTVLHTINSIFGHPEDMLSIQADTMISRMERVGIYNSISATYDEITDIPRDDLSALCYNISQGRGKDRADKSGNIRENHTHWKMIMACTANKSMYDVLGTGGFNMSGQSMRVFEFRIDPQKFMSLSESQRVFGKLFDNYGHAGEIFIKYVMEHKGEIKQRLQAMGVKFEEAAQISIPERYWSNIASCCIVAGEICRELELNTFNVDNVFQWAVNQLKSMRGSVVEAKYDSTGILTEFMNNHISSTLIVNGVGDKKTPFWVEANGEPRGSLMIRNEVDTNFAYISRSAIKQWITKNSGDYSAVKRDLMNAGILVNADMRKVLSANSNTTKTGQVDCWQVNVGHQAMSGVSLKVVESKEQASV